MQCFIKKFFWQAADDANNIDALPVDLQSSIIEELNGFVKRMSTENIISEQLEIDETF